MALDWHILPIRDQFQSIWSDAVAVAGKRVDHFTIGFAVFGQDECDHKTSNISAHSLLFHNSIKVCFVALMMVTHSDEMHTFTLLLIYIILT